MLLIYEFLILFLLVNVVSYLQNDWFDHSSNYVIYYILKTDDKTVYN